MLPKDFWESSDRYRDQKFYTAFCILEAACSDYAVSVKLRRQNSLNWACTASYYSLVHALRLICFVETGDFPTLHAPLAKLFKGEQERNRDTWVGQNRGYFPQQVEPNRNFQFAITSLEERKRLGEVLDRARPLRNDANYEGLLISHGYSHAQVTQSFQRLATSLKDASEQVLLKMIEVFKGFVDNSPRRNPWYAFLNWESGHRGRWGVSDRIGEGLYYLEASLKYRGANDRDISKIRGWLSGLYCQPDLNTVLAEEVHDNIVTSAFAMKSSLMNDFETKIDDFEDLLKKRFGEQ